MTVTEIRCLSIARLYSQTQVGLACRDIHTCIGGAMLSQILVRPWPYRPPTGSAGPDCAMYLPIISSSHVLVPLLLLLSVQ